jgi:hypothetical protein
LPSLSLPPLFPSILLLPLLIPSFLPRSFPNSSFVPPRILSFLLFLIVPLLQTPGTPVLPCHRSVQQSGVLSRKQTGTCVKPWS